MSRFLRFTVLGCQFQSNLSSLHRAPLVYELRDIIPSTPTPPPVDDFSLGTIQRCVRDTRRPLTIETHNAVNSDSVCKTDTGMCRIHQKCCTGHRSSLRLLGDCSTFWKDSESKRYVYPCYTGSNDSTVFLGHFCPLPWVVLLNSQPSKED